MNVNDYVKWNGTDLFGKFQYFGQVIKTGLKHNIVELNIPGLGIVGAQADDGEFTVIDKPKNWDTLNQHFVPRVKPGMSGDRIFEDQPEPERKTAVKTVSKTVEVKEKPHDGLSNKDRAINVYNGLKVDGVHPSRTVAIEALMAIGLSKNTASTYQHNCKSDWCK